MKKVVANVVVVLLASLYLLAKGIDHAVQQAGKEMKPYIGVVSLIQMIAFISASIVGFGLLGVFIAVLKGGN